MYDARAVANFFIERALKRGAPITIMTLLKVLYFSHAWYLVKTSNPLVGQPFEAWKHGPVNRVVYDQFKNYGDKPLDKLAVSFDPVRGGFVSARCEFDQTTRQFLEHIFDYYSHFHPYRLSDLTHEAGGPWEAIWRMAERQAVPGMIIPNDLICAWFKAREPVYRT